MATGAARYGYEVPAATTTPTDTGGSLSGSDKAGIITAAIGAIGGIVDSLKGLWSGNGTNNAVTLKDQNLATLGTNNRSNNTWIWVAGGMVVVALVVFLVLRKKK